MTSLVTGAGGFVGTHLIDDLLAAGQTVRALLRNEEQAARLRQRGIDTYVGSVCDRELVVRAAEGVNTIYHCAAAGSWCTPQEIRETNLEGVRNVLEAVRPPRSGRVVLLSSINALGSRSYRNATEELPCRRSGEAHADVKRESELLAESYARDHGVDVVILRPGLVYGVGTHHLPKMISAIRRGKFRFIGSRDNVVPIVYISDLVQAMRLAAERPEARGRTYHITDGSAATIGELVGYLAEFVGCEPPKKVLPYFVPRLACTIFELLGKKGPINRTSLRFLGTSRHVDIRRARTELGYSPQVSLRAGLEKTKDWLLQAATDLEKVTA